MSTPVGEFELLILLAVHRLKDNAYAVTVREEIEARTGRAVPRGSVYVTIDRLVRKGYLQERSAAGAAEREGRPRRVFRVTADGTRATRDALAGIRNMQKGLAF
jgi:PadR family transcriptional regulator PadR